MSRLAVASVGLSALILVVIIPAFELNDTHITNPDWPAHARLHEAWQLLTNAGIAVFALWCVWTDRAPRMGISLALIICASFLTAWAMGSAYGGSMLHSDGTQTAIAGINVVVIVVMVLTSVLLASLLQLQTPRNSRMRGDHT